MTELLTPTGRLVTGHPMVSSPQKDRNGAPKLGKDGSQLVQFYVGLAIPKQGEQDWKQTTWGQVIHQIAVEAFPKGEYMQPTFAWKIDDGDSQVPNKKGKIPNQREGWPGHWVLHISNGFPFSCYHEGNFSPYQSIQNKDEIKTGDYCRLLLDVKGNNINGPNESPGVYLNPMLFSLVRAGIRIVSANEPDAAAAFATPAVLPQGALVDTSVQAPAPQAQAPAPQAQAPTPQAQAPAAPTPGSIAPAPDVLNPQAAAAPPPPAAPQDPVYLVEGKPVLKSALIAAGWTEAQVAGLQQAPF